MKTEANRLIKDLAHLLTGARTALGGFIGSDCQVIGETLADEAVIDSSDEAVGGVTYLFTDGSRIIRYGDVYFVIREGEC